MSAQDLEQFREACNFMKAYGSRAHCVQADRLLSIIDNAGKVAHQPAPVVDDARMARALEWVRDVAQGMPASAAKEHLPAIEEAIAAYDPSCGARTVCVVDDAMRPDAERYRWLRSSAWYVGPDPNGDTEGVSLDDKNSDDLDSAIDAARAQGVQS